MYISDSLVCVLDLLHRYYPVSPYPRKLFADFFQHDCFVPRTLVTAFGHHLTDIQNFDSHSSLSRSPSVLLPIFSTLFSELSNAQASSVTSSDPLVQTTIKLLQSFSSFQAACLSHSDTIVQVNHVTTIAVEIPSVGKDMIFSERRLVQRIRHKTEDPSFQQSATFYETFFVFLRKQCSTERPLVDTLPSVQFSALLGLGEIATQLIRGLYNPSSYIQSAMIAMEFLSYCCSSVRFDKNGNVLAIAASLFSVNQILESLLKHRLYQHVHQHDIVDSQPTSATHEENLGENEDAGEGMLKDEDETNQSEKKPNTQNDPKGKPDVFRQAFTLSSVAVCLTSMIESCLLPLLHSFSDSSTKGNPTGMDDLVDTLTNTFIYLIDIDASLIMRHLEDIWKLFLSLLFPQGQHCDFSRGILRCLTMVLRAMISSAVKRNDLEQIISVLLNTRFLNTNLLETAVSLSTESSDSASPLYLILTSFEQSLNTLPVTQFESLVELSTNILDSTHDQILDALEANSSTFIPICHRFVFVTNGLIALLRSLTLNASILTTQLLTSIQSSLKGFSEQLRTKKTKKGKDKNLLTLLTLLLDKQDKEQKNRPVHHYYLSLVTTVLDLSSFLDVTLNRLKSVHSLTPLSTSTSTPTLSLSEACFTLYSQILLTNHKLLEHPGLLLSVTQSAYLALSAHSSSHVSLLCNLPKHDEESQTYIDIYPHLLHQITHTKSNQNNVQGLSLSILLRLLDHLVSISQETTLHLVHETITALISCRFSSDEGIAICPVHFSTIPPPQYIRSDECTVHYSVTSGHAQLSMRVDAPLSHTSFNISSSLADYQIAFPQLRLLSPIDCLPSLSEVATDYLSSSDALELPNYSESLLSALNALFSHKQHIHFILEFLLSLSSDIFVSLSTLITDQTKSFLTSLVSLLASSKTKTDILFPATRVYIRFLNTIRALPSARQTSSKNGDAKKVGELFGVIHDSTLRLKIIQTVIDKLPPSLFSQLIINLYCTVPFYTSSTHSLLKSLKEELKSVQDVKGLSHTNQLIVASSS
ncbi:hypothetical protein BLNAU_17409 [Blattamonas nauphoetae]|uniref:Uncharacterized protein n=1 Tax=Blattamonas nauphoetae TaxID=2049346 RepID=A0ABQ9X8U9_9EUKA|nr:hypothetical protein BLNAU_17409 [Blattamonas nauphoetae]